MWEGYVTEGMEREMGHLLVSKTKTGDQLHIVYVDEKYGQLRRTSCGSKVHSVLPNNYVLKVRPNLLCEKCFHLDLPRENVKNIAEWKK